MHSLAVLHRAALSRQSGVGLWQCHNETRLMQHQIEYCLNPFIVAALREQVKDWQTEQTGEICHDFRVLQFNICCVFGNVPGTIPENSRKAGKLERWVRSL